MLARTMHLRVSTATFQVKKFALFQQYGFVMVLFQRTEFEKI